MNKQLEELWNREVPPGSKFELDRISSLPEGAQSFLRHAIAADAPLVSKVRLKMHGEIKLKKWVPFVAEQVISYPDELVWAAKAKVGFSITGYDSLIGHEGRMDWKLLGLIRVMKASGPDISRSAAGRMAGELCWLPTALLSPEVLWESSEGNQQRLSVQTPRGHVNLTLTLAEDGALRECQIERWGNPGGGEFRLTPFGVVFSAERKFCDFTIGSELRAGWGYPSNPDGEFFRASIDDAQYR